MVMSDKRYYHGTATDITVGTVLIPGTERGVNNFGDADNSVVWLHDNPNAAARYGQFVYEVEPREWVENFSEQAGHADDGLPESEWEYITPAARVLALRQCPCVGRHRCRQWHGLLVTVRES